MLVERRRTNRINNGTTTATVKVRYLDKEEEKKIKEALVLRDNELKDKRASRNKWREEGGYDCFPALHQFNFADYLCVIILPAS